MKYVVFGLALLYALLSLYAAFNQRKRPQYRLSAVLMALGGLVLISAAILCLTGWTLDWALSIIGTLLIVEAAVLSGKLTGRTHPKHHAVRFVITLLLIVGFAIW